MAKFLRIRVFLTARWHWNLQPERSGMAWWAGTRRWIAVAAGTLMAACLRESTSSLPPLPPGTRVGHYAAPPPFGTSTGDGTSDAPWDLATALGGGHGNHIQPGDTVWLRRGTYAGSFQTTLEGTTSAPIIFRQYPGERATIDGSLASHGSNLWFWGFEIMQSNNLRSTERVLGANTENGRFINLVLHDAGISGVSMIKDGGAGAELYGSIIYNNGHNDNIDHGIYAHNATTGTKYITDNVFFNNCARGIQIYDDGPLIQSIQVVGNVSFDNGTLTCLSNRTNLLVSAPATTLGMVVKDNLLYFAPGLDGTQVLLGNYDTLFNQNIDVENNFAVGGTLALQMDVPWVTATVQHNVWIGNGSTAMVHMGGTALGGYTWTGNVYSRAASALAWEHNGTVFDFSGWKAATGLGADDSVAPSALTSSWVFLRPNKYEPGRAFIIVYNLANDASVTVDISTVVAAGVPYEVRNVQDLFNQNPLVGGTYGGGAIPSRCPESPLPDRLAGARTPQRPARCSMSSC